MAVQGEPSRANIHRIEELVDLYREHEPKLGIFLRQILPLFIDQDKILVPNVHSIKWRLKGVESLREKLKRKMCEANDKGAKFSITPKNFFVKVNDLVGIRMLHLYTRQMEEIHRDVKVLLSHARFNIKEGPFARTWDDETREFFDNLGTGVEKSGPSMYTSVHYIIDSNSQTRYTAEIQVGTLAEELWGEVTHKIDYPVPCPDIACKEQIRVLARVTSSCTRLVDSIFRSYAEYLTKSTLGGRSKGRLKARKSHV